MSQKARPMPRTSGGVDLSVVTQDGDERPGWTLRAGDFITRTDYDHERRLMVATVGEVALPWRTRLRRWWEGRR
jgi:hypothetical protein